MKLKKSLISESEVARRLLLSFVTLGLSACSLDTSEEVVKDQIGRSLSDVIAIWGFPTGEREIAGRKLVYWEDKEKSYEGLPTVGVAVPIGDGGKVSAAFPLVEPRQLVCTRTLEINRKEEVVQAALDGNDCPYFAPSDWT